MKSLIVTSSLPDIVYFWADDEFISHLNQVFVKDQVISENHDQTTIDLNVALQYFSPLILSQRCMNRENCGYRSITLGNGMIIVIDQSDDYIYLVLNGDGQESEDFLRRKLRFFQCLVCFHFGPNTELLKPENKESRKYLWESLSNILGTYCLLCCQQQGFLVEANEMIQVNQRVNVMGIRLLESVISKANKEGDPQAKHAMLLVNSKVLALYSHNNASKLQAPDIMLLTTLVCSKFPFSQQSIPLSVNRTPPPLAHEIIKFDDVHIKPKDFVFESAEEDSRSSPFGELRSTSREIKSPNTAAHPMSDSPEVFFPTSSGEQASGTHSIENLDQLSKGSKGHSSDSMTSDKYFTPEEDGQFLPQFTERSSFVKPHARLWDETSNSSNNSYVDADNELFRRRIFLRLQPTIYIPHTVHCLQISPGTVLVIISEVKKGELSKEICSLVSFLSGLIEDKPNMKDTTNVVEKMEQHVRKISEGFKAKSTQVKEKNVETYVNAFRQKWEKVKANELQDYLQKKQRLLPGKLEGALVDMSRSLMALFGAAYCAGDTVKGPSISIHHAKTLYRIQEMVQNELKDYKGFLSVKGERNVTMTSYLEEFPGLVHFIYIDRTANRVIAPSINTDVTQIFNHRDAAHFVKQSIWDGWNYMQTFLIQGHMNVSVRYGDFLFTYILWFEDSSGNQRNVRDTNAFVKEFPDPPGIIGSYFYSELKRRCFPSTPRDKICCHELFCMHLGILPLNQATGHARRLAAMMWEVSGGAMVVPLLV